MNVDTHALFKEFVAHGLTEPQAETMTTLVENFVTKEEFQEHKDQVATKNDILLLKNDITLLKSELKAEMAYIKTDIIKWMMPMFLAIIGLMITVIVKLFS